MVGQAFQPDVKLERPTYRVERSYSTVYFADDNVDTADNGRHIRD
jgi:hypothetical protein